MPRKQGEPMWELEQIRMTVLWLDEVDGIDSPCFIEDFDAFCGRAFMFLDHYEELWVAEKEMLPPIEEETDHHLTLVMGVSFVESGASYTPDEFAKALNEAFVVPQIGDAPKFQSYEDMTTLLEELLSFRHEFEQMIVETRGIKKTD